MRFLNEEELYNFISCVGKIDVRTIAKKSADVQKDIEQEVEI